MIQENNKDYYSDIIYNLLITTIIADHKKEEKKHLEGLKELKEQYKKFDREGKKIIRAMKILDKKQEAAEFNQEQSQ